MASSKAIVGLMRGYNDLNRYNQLIARNVGIWATINNELKYPLIIFHEGNIQKKHQQEIIDKSCGQTIEFRDISRVWKGGYEGMCRFMIYDIWQQCSEFEYVMRIDEDCILHKSLYDPFDQIENAFAPYMTSVWWAESHSETNATLPGFIHSITGADPKDFYNDRYPYTNVSLAKVSFMQSLKELKIIAESKLQRPNRWGDLPVIGALLNIYAKGKVGTLSGLAYYHASHNMQVICE